MEKVRTEHSGNFTITGYGQSTPNGEYVATFVVTEARADGEIETKRSTGEKFRHEMDAAEAGLKAGVDWLENYRPPNPWEAKE